MRVFVTGVDGFLGLRLAARLIASGHQVGGLVLEREAAVERGVPKEVELVEGDLLAITSLHTAIKDFAPESVVHLGGLSHVGESWQSLSRYFQVNVLGTENVLEAAQGRVLFASSSEVYGLLDPRDLPVTEDAPLAPASPYALCKAAAERLAIAKGAIVVRMFNLVGPGQAEAFALPSFARQLAAIRQGRSEPVLKVGNLSAQRDFVHVDDAAEALELLVARGEPGGTYNLASGVAVELRQALESLIAIAGCEVRVEHDPERTRPVDVPVVSGDAGRLRALGWRPRRDLDRALADLWESLDH